jgi:hypothetical protein
MPTTRSRVPQETADGKHIIGPDGQLVPIARKYTRDPRWDTETWEPGIVFDEPIDLMKLLDEDEDAKWAALLTRSDGNDETTDEPSEPSVEPCWVRPRLLPRISIPAP